MPDGHTLPEVFDQADVEQPLQVEISMSDDVFIKQITIRQAGVFVPQHSHAFDHTSLLAVGSMRVWQNGIWLGDFVAPVPVHIKAGARHTMQALTDGVVFYCIHNTARAGVVEELERWELPTVAPDRELCGDADGVVIAEEAWADFWRDGQVLFRQHEAEVGPRPGVTLDINAPLAERIEAAGGACIVTARCNGRMVGYLASIVAPSIEDRSLLTGTATGFYVSRDFRGIGPRLLRAAVEAMRVRGVGEVILRAGVRGSGPKLPALYRRMGAVPHGELFSLNLRGA